MRISTKFKIAIIFFSVQSVFLVALGFSSAYVIFSSDSGWQFGFALILSFQLFVLAFISSLIFGSAYGVSKNTISYTESAAISATIVVLSMFIVLPVGCFISGIAAWGLFQIAIILGAFLSPSIITWYKG